MMARLEVLGYSILALMILGMVTLGGCTTQEGSESGDSYSSYIMIIFMVLIFAAFYFLLIRPQRKKQKEHGNLIESLQKGDKVVTIGGILGTIDSISEHEVILRVEGGNKLKMLKSSIAGKQPE